MVSNRIYHNARRVSCLKSTLCLRSQQESCCPSTLARRLKLRWKWPLTLLNMPDFVPEESFIQDARSAVERDLAKCHKALAEKGVKSKSAIEVGNDVAGNILEAIDREHIDMVVISTHGMSGWHPLVFGSIAEKVVKLVQCPLLLLHSSKPDTGTKTRSARSMEWW